MSPTGKGPSSESPAATEVRQTGLQAECHRALELCREEEWTEGLVLTRRLVAQHGKSDELPGAVFAYLGYALARFEHKLDEGLSLCRHGVKLSPADPETFFNLARIHLLGRRRRQAVLALHKGLALDPRHWALRELQRAIGWRNKPVVPFLRRDNPINRILGRLRVRFAPEQDPTDRAIW